MIYYQTVVTSFCMTINGEYIPLILNLGVTGMMD